MSTYILFEELNLPSCSRREPPVLTLTLTLIWYHWFIPENYDYQLSSKRLQAQTVALNSAFTFLLYFFRFAATKLREPGCFTTLSVKVTK